VSKAVSSTRKIPFSLSLGISEFLAEEKINRNDFLSELSNRNKRTFLTETSNLVFVCGNKQKPNDYQPNPLLAFFSVRRALAMKSQTRQPVIILVNNRYEGEPIIDHFNKLSPCFKLYHTNKSRREKINKEIRADFENEADFILTTYETFWNKATNKKNPKSEQIILINPLRKKKIIKDLSELDVIFGCNHRHKCLKPNYSFILDEAQFPLLTKKDYHFLFNTNNRIFYRCEERKNYAHNNPFRNATPLLSDDQYQLFIFRELFRGRKLPKELIERFKSTFTYKLYLFSNGLFPSLKDETNKKEFEREEARLDHKVIGELIEQLKHLTKGNRTKTITGKITYNNHNFTSDTAEQEIITKYSWSEPKEATRVLPLITKSKGRYQLSALGEEIFAVSSSFGGIEENFSEIFSHYSRILYKNKEENCKFSAKEIIIFYIQLLGFDPEVIIAFNKRLPERIDTETKSIEMIEFIEKNIKPITNSYKRNNAKKFLGAFEKLMNTEAYLFFQRFKNYQKKEKRSWEERRRERILQEANRKPLTVRYIGEKYRMFWQESKKELEFLRESGLIVRITTFNKNGKGIYKYLTQELLDAHPYLQKNCGKCQWYNKRFRTCAYLRLKQAYNPSNMVSEELGRANGQVNFEATACGNFKDKADFQSTGEKVRYTITVEELTRKMMKVPIGLLSGNVNEIEYHCLSCQKQIMEFGTSNSIVFHRRKVKCPKCSTVYQLQKNKRKVLVKTEQRHLLREIIYRETTSTPYVLKVNDPEYVFVIHDRESAKIRIGESNEESPFYLVIKKHEIPLSMVQFILFPGRHHQELEQALKQLKELEPEKYSYKIERKIQDQKSKNANGRYLDPFSYEDYEGIKEIIKKISDEEIFNHPFLQARHLSNIAGMLQLKYEAELESYSSWSYDYQLLKMNDLLMKVKGGNVSSNYYGTLLEAQSNNYFFEVMKEEAKLVDLWTKGRVNSRLVIDILLSFSKKVSSAFSPLDAIVNQMIRLFRIEVDKIFHKLGLDPEQLGPGLFHRRKTKSDIDQLGFYFDLIEAVRVLALVTITKTVKEEKIGFSDCRFVLGENGQEIYQVKGSSLDKFNEIVSEALNQSVSDFSETTTFQKAFEYNLHCLRLALKKSLSIQRKHGTIFLNEIKKIFDASQFSPFVYKPVESVEKLILLNRFADEEGAIFYGCEQKVLARKKAREESRDEEMNHWYKYEVIKKSADFRLTKHQKKEQRRSLLVLLLLLFYAFEKDLTIKQYSTSELKNALGLNHNQIKRILEKMVAREIITRTKIDSENFFQLNLENQNVKNLRFLFGINLTKDEEFQRELINDAPYQIIQVAKTITPLFTVSDYQCNNSLNSFWFDWQPTNTILEALYWINEKITRSTAFYKMIGEING